MSEQIIIAVMKESVFKSIDTTTRSAFKDWSREPDDYEELKKDETFCKLYKDYQQARNKLNDYKYKLRNKNNG